MRVGGAPWPARANTEAAGIELEPGCQHHAKPAGVDSREPDRQLRVVASDRPRSDENGVVPESQAVREAARRLAA